MKLLKISIIFLILFTFQSMSYNNHKVLNNLLFKHYKWLTPKLHKEIRKVSNYYKVDINLICAIITAESNGRNIISRLNTNGTRDYGIMQVNAVHMPKNPKRLLHIPTNLRYGTSYLHECSQRSQDIKTVIRFYNQGYNGKAQYYRNWGYVNKVYTYYINFKNKLRKM